MKRHQMVNLMRRMRRRGRRMKRRDLKTVHSRRRWRLSVSGQGHGIASCCGTGSGYRTAVPLKPG
jgi:hypothetical protein